MQNISIKLIILMIRVLGRYRHTPTHQLYVKYLSLKSKNISRC